MRRILVPAGLVALALALIVVLPPMFDGTFELSWLLAPEGALMTTFAAVALVVAAIAHVATHRQQGATTRD